LTADTFSSVVNSVNLQKNTEFAMSNKGQLLQDPFLNALRKEHVPVSI
jgi:host factor-I protein